MAVVVRTRGNFVFLARHEFYHRHYRLWSLFHCSTTCYPGGREHFRRLCLQAGSLSIKRTKRKRTNARGNRKTGKRAETKIHAEMEIPVIRCTRCSFRFDFVDFQQQCPSENARACFSQVRASRPLWNSLISAGNIFYIFWLRQNRIRDFRIHKVETVEFYVGIPTSRCSMHRRWMHN